MKKSLLFLTTTTLLAGCIPAWDDNAVYQDNPYYEERAYKAPVRKEPDYKKTAPAVVQQKADPVCSCDYCASKKGCPQPVEYMYEPYAYADAVYAAPAASPCAYSEPTAQPATIILQHPTQRDLVACQSADTACLAAYQQYGYVQLRNTPHFAGYQDTLTGSDYPGTGRWRHQNNIPRW